MLDQVDRVAHRDVVVLPLRQAGSMVLQREGSRRALGLRRRVEVPVRLSRLRVDRRNTLGTLRAHRTARSILRMDRRRSREGRVIGSEATLRYFATFRFGFHEKLSSHPPPCCSCSLMLLLRVSVSYVSRLFSFFFYISLTLSSLLSFSHTSLSLTSCTFIVNYSYKIESLCGLRQSIRSVCVVITCGRETAKLEFVLHYTYKQGVHILKKT